MPSARWQRIAMPCNPISPAMWAEAGRWDGPCDAVHASAFPYAFPIVCALRLARRRGVPLFLTPFLHLGDTDRTDRTRRKYLSPGLASLLREADRVFVQTPSEFDAVVGCGVPTERVVLQGLGVDPAECTGGLRGKARSAWGVGEDEIVVGHLANQSEEKGTCDLLRAAERAWQAGAKFRVVLAGPRMTNFRRFWESFGPKANVIELGRITDDEKRDFFAGIDAFALPSRSDSFGLVLLEAWANRVPNVAYRAGGVADVIRHGEDGLLVPCGNIDGLAVALRSISTDAAMRRSFGETGFRRLPRDFNWDDKLAIVRRELCPGGRQGARETALAQV